MTPNSRRGVGEPKVLRDYDTWPKKLGHSEEDPLRLPWYASVWSELQKHPGGRLLEVGCGRGEFAIWLARNAPQFKIVALDFSAVTIDLATTAASAAHAEVHFLQGNAEALPFDDGSFDVVMSCECLEHVPSPPIMTQEIARVLKPGGVFF